MDLLPDPIARPNADIVIYDGNCDFCRRQVERLARLDRKGRLAGLSLHDPEVQRRFPDLSHDQLMQQMYVVDRAGRRHGGAAAVRYLSRRLPALWPIAPFLHIPWTMPFWQWAYNKIAIRRYRWNQTDEQRKCEENGACEAHFRR